MPAPLGKTPTKKMPNIQVFGRDDSNADPRRAPVLPRAARSSSTTSTCARSRSPAASSGASSTGWAPRRCSTTTSARTATRASRYLAMDDAGTIARLLADARLLRLPLVRYGERVTAGKAEETWKAWLARPR